MKIGNLLQEHLFPNSRLIVLILFYNRKVDRKCTISIKHLLARLLVYGTFLKEVLS